MAKYNMIIPGHNYKATKMDIVARDYEVSILEKILVSNKPEFVVVYGRRRVGKTFLIKNFFRKKNCIFLHVTGIEKGAFVAQRKNFCRRLSEVFHHNLPLSVPKDWDGVFSILKSTIETVNAKEKVVIFLDEFPWMATPRSKLLEVLEYFWNEYWGNDKRIKLFICGSLASWIIKNIIHNTGGLFQRVTSRLKIDPFDLSQTKLFLESKGVRLTNQQVTTLYMATGGVPLYLEQAQRGLTADQMIDQLCFHKNGLLFDEMKELFKSLFKNEAIYLKITQEISKHRHGISKEELAKILKLPRGGRLTARLEELADAGFIISFIPYQYKERGEFFKIFDEYTMFYFYWIKPNIHSIRSFSKPTGVWLDIIKEGKYYAWKGASFESICYKHISCIMKLLHLKQSSIPYSWRLISSKANSISQGAQIDLLFDRPDDAISLCEIKYTEHPFVIDKDYFQSLENKKMLFSEQTKTKKQIFMILISANGLKENKYSTQVIDSIIHLNDFFIKN